MSEKTAIILTIAIVAFGVVLGLTQAQREKRAEEE